MADGRGGGNHEHLLILLIDGLLIQAESACQPLRAPRRPHGQLCMPVQTDGHRQLLLLHHHHHQSALPQGLLLQAAHLQGAYTVDGSSHLKAAWAGQVPEQQVWRQHIQTLTAAAVVITAWCHDSSSSDSSGRGGRGL